MAAVLAMMLFFLVTMDSAAWQRVHAFQLNVVAAGKGGLDVISPLVKGLRTVHHFEDSAHAGAIGLALEPLAPVPRTSMLQPL